MLALLAFVELEVTLTALAIGYSLRARPRAYTVGATALAAALTALGLVFAWVVWFVAPACVSDPNLIGCTSDRVGVDGVVYVVEIALLEWAWMIGVSLFARLSQLKRGFSE
jgi:hypothetical protein